MRNAAEQVISMGPVNQTELKRRKAKTEYTFVKTKEKIGTGKTGE